VQRRSYSVVDRLIDILECFFDGDETSMTQLAQRTGFDPATASRYLARLEAREWVERDPVTKLYRLGARLIAVGNSAAGSRPLMEAGRDHMDRLAKRYNETVNLAMRVGDDLLIVDAIESTRSIKRGAQLGERDNWHSSSVGKAILAHLDPAELNQILKAHPPVAFTPKTLTDRAVLDADLAAVRRRGYALDLEEGELGLRCVGVALLDKAGSPAFAISMSGPADRLPEKVLHQIGRDLASATRELRSVDGAIVDEPKRAAR
jgi:IclR family acetate operon transcriptional repressor